MRISYSALDTYKNCGLRFKLKNIDKIPEAQSKEAWFGTLIHSVLRYVHSENLVPPAVAQALDFYSKKWDSTMYDNEIEERSAYVQGVQIIQKYYQENDIAKANVIALESRFAIEIGDEASGKHVVSGIIDRIDKTEDGYEIIDYKTSRTLPSQDKVDNDIQLSIYLKAFLSRYPKEVENIENITVSLYFVKHGVKLSSKRSLEQLEQVEKIFLDVIAAIEREDFEPHLSPLCAWCGYQPICPLWRHKFKEERKMDSEEIQEVIKRFLELKMEAKTAKKELTELQNQIFAYMAEEEVERVFDDAGIIAKTTRKTYEYDEKTLRSILEPLDHWDDVIKVDSISLRAISRALPEAIRQQIEEAKRLKSESVALSIKKPNLEVDEDLAD